MINKKIHFTLFALIIFIKGCGGGSTSSTENINITGPWVGTVSIENRDCRGNVSFNFNQNSNTVTGNVNVNYTEGCTGSGTSSFKGEINGKSISLTDDDGDIYSLTLNSNNRISGNVLAERISTRFIISISR